jgi:hypothetical protein
MTFLSWLPPVDQALSLSIGVKWWILLGKGDYGIAIIGWTMYEGARLG